MTTATPLGGTPFFSVNMTTREEDFLYKSKVTLAWRPGEGGRAGQVSWSSPGVEVKSMGYGDKLPESQFQSYHLPTL